MPAKKLNILLADDDPQLLRLVTRNLQLAGYDVVAVADGRQALDRIEASRFDLVILDVMMPKLDGFSVCERVREFSSVPILILTSRGLDQDKVHGLDVGADDYLTKPFSVDVFLAHVRAVVRRSHFAADHVGPMPPLMVKLGDLSIDFAQHRVVLSGHEIALTPIEYRLLSCLAQNVGRVVTQDSLLEQVWGKECIGESHLLQVYMNRLRRKIEADPRHPQYLKTTVGVGYKLAASMRNPTELH